MEGNTFLSGRLLNKYKDWLSLGVKNAEHRG